MNIESLKKSMAEAVAYARGEIPLRTTTFTPKDDGTFEKKTQVQYRDGKPG